MFSPKRFPKKPDEFVNLGVVADGLRESSASRAIDAWEDEGGGSAEALDGLAARTALADISGWRANNAGCQANHSGEKTTKNASAQALTSAGEEDRLLRCLGAAVIMRWNTIPTKLQRELFDHASCVEQLQAGAGGTETMEPSPTR